MSGLRFRGLDWLRDALELVAILGADRVVLAIDHLETLLERRTDRISPGNRRPSSAPSDSA